MYGLIQDALVILLGVATLIALEGDACRATRGPDPAVRGLLTARPSVIAFDLSMRRQQ